LKSKFTFKHEYSPASIIITQKIFHLKLKDKKKTFSSSSLSLVYSRGKTHARQT
jgi:hypothetical protein